MTLFKIAHCGDDRMDQVIIRYAIIFQKEIQNQ